MRNKLKYYRHLLQIDTQKEYAEFLGFSQYSINRWEKQVSQPDIDSYYQAFQRIKARIPETHLEDHRPMGDELRSER